MSKCIKCGRELNTGETLEIYSGMCGKCYEEQYDKFIKKIDGKYLFGVIEKPLRQQIDQLKQQLAEKDKEIAHLKEKDNYHLRYELAGADETITNLKQQLEEKDKEIERLKNLFELNNEVVINQGKEIFDLRVQVLQQKQKQNQTQLAIQELEKVKTLIQNAINFETNFVGVYDAINNQIKELKGEKE